MMVEGHNDLLTSLLDIYNYHISKSFSQTVGTSRPMLQAY